MIDARSEAGTVTGDVGAVRVRVAPSIRVRNAAILVPNADSSAEVGASASTKCRLALTPVTCKPWVPSHCDICSTVS
ncbi:hypothetical protein SAMN05421837_111292 [Amycolatopsis pretoriensis]|uniref:Uncharacterized protein n=1 Tax=Amycolatopsis pretoriensis TaxID=218821 RepID=A0A1H5RHB6_9PSEU|nr:hypothetical protein SAMN05421837_111292 [Amycolatopsis pretoriensis]